MPTQAVRRLALDAFRNYDNAVFELPVGPVILVGENGAGKTSLLEAISLLAPGRGLRGASIAEIQNHFIARPWAMSVQIEGRKGQSQIGVGADPESPREKRVLRVDGKTGKSSFLLEQLSILWLTPEMDRLLAESASERRRFMDRLVFVLNAEHRTRVGRYEEAMRSRLRILREGPFDDTWLNALEDAMAREGMAIAASRKEWADCLASHFLADPTPFPPVHVHVEGFAENLIETKAALDAEETFRATLKENRQEDAACGTTAHGPHRSDLRVFHSASGLPAALCSSGEQKALLISLILAQARLLHALHGSAPLLLLDDITAHLDEARREALATQTVELGCQAWLTGTDAGFFDAFRGDAEFFHLEKSPARIVA
jgi:DNA replication and repair protein RecF